MKNHLIKLASSTGLVLLCGSVSAQFLQTIPPASANNSYHSRTENVGIGTIPSEDPQNKLQVIPGEGGPGIQVGYDSSPELSIREANNLQFKNTGGAGYFSTIAQMGIGSGLSFSTNGSAITDAKMVLLSEGKIGIGNIAPAAKLHLSDGFLQIDGTNGNPSTGGFHESWTLNHWHARIKTPLAGSWITTEANDAGKYMGMGMTSTGWYFIDDPNPSGNNTGTANYPFVVRSSGKVGIGKSTPWAKLHVNNGYIMIDGISQNEDEGGFAEAWTLSHWETRLKTPIAGSWVTSEPNDMGRYMGFGMTNTGWYFIDNPSASGHTGTIANYPFVVRSSGKVGIGKSTPWAKLHVSNGFIQIDGELANEEQGGFFESWTEHHWHTRIKTPIAGAWVTSEPNEEGKYMGIGMTNTGWYFISSDGPSGSNVSGKYPFAVDLNGKLTTREVEVSLTAVGGWPDFVFNEAFELKDLNEVEDFIDENKHLPGVPSEKEVKENGINLGEMDGLLLQKIEELTLYTIQQQKELDELKKVIQALKN